MASKSHDEIIKQIGSMSVLELADLVKQLEETFGVSAAMPVAAAAAAPAAAAAAPAQEEKSEYKVTLKKVNGDKIKAIKALRKALPNLNLSDAKKAVEEAPTVLVEAASKADADKIKKTLVEEGDSEVELA